MADVTEFLVKIVLPRSAIDEITQKLEGYSIAEYFSDRIKEELKCYSVCVPTIEDLEESVL